jgi:hypothetical protein
LTIENGFGALAVLARKPCYRPFTLRDQKNHLQTSSHHFGILSLSENSFTLIPLPSPLTGYFYDFLQGKFRYTTEDEKEFS